MVILMTEEEKRRHRCVVAGHRPERLKIEEQRVREFLEREIKAAYNSGMNVFICGMARGVDQWAADIVLKMKKNHPDIRLICALPYSGFEQMWSEKDKRKGEEIIAQADLIRVICGGYERSCFQRRNRWMVERASRLIAVWNGQPSGTADTIKRACETGMEVIIYIYNK
ncbi:MAG: DUF1273 domain-containing protein [Ruminococcaceae bacterium]|nr:DUF1273 domain-containing protein [Oscillospiraceae bacterium]